MKRLEWTPNRINLEVDAKEPTTVLVNQNWAREWRASVGTVRSEEQLLAVDVPAGKNVVVLEYKDRFLDVCLLVSLLSLLGIAFVMVRDGSRWAHRERARWATLPFWPDGSVPTLCPEGRETPTPTSGTAEKADDVAPPSAKD